MTGASRKVTPSDSSAPACAPACASLGASSGASAGGQKVLDESLLEGLRALDGGGDGSLLRSLLGVYGGHVPRALDELRNAFQNANHEAVRKSAHALRSSSASLGALEVANHLEEIETAAGKISPSSTEWQKDLRVLEQEIQTALKALEAYIQKVAK